MSGDPILIEIDPTSWRGHIQNIEGWLGLLLMKQSAFRQSLQDVHPTLQEPHVKQFIGLILENARKHEAQAEKFFALIGRDPSDARKRAGSALAKWKQASSGAMARVGGAEGSWVGLHGLMPISLEAQSAFAVAEQLALAVGLREMAEMAFDIENEQNKDHLILKELVLETASLSILYKMPV